MKRRNLVRAAAVAISAWLVFLANHHGERRAEGREAMTNRSASSELWPVSVSRGAAGHRYRLEPFDAAAQRSLHPGRKGTPLRFAQAVPVALTTESHGTWEHEGGHSRWRLAIEAPGAVNLNLGFSRFALPESASLELRSAEGDLLVRPFTAADNEEHGELWTPVISGDALELVLDVAEEDRGKLQLELGAINRGFRSVRFAVNNHKIGGTASTGNCYIDVVCSGAESGVGPLIDVYRDQIQSAGVFTLGGVDTCSGAAVNNTRNDGTPLFLTAHHCGVRANNAASMVVYWNFENSTCRSPGTVANGSDGDGPVTQFSSGALFRATYSDADATLVELDDPLDPDHEVFLAGWSRTGVPSMAAGVHFPNLSEKRISFDLDAVVSTNDSSGTPNPNGTHWRVLNWEFGSTERGSSGSPLLDQDGRIVGQLTGGFAECGNLESDWYGKLAQAWTGGGTSSSRLSDWLDPDGTGALTLDGIGASGVRVRIADATVTEGDSGTIALQFTVALDEAASEVIQLVYSTQSDFAEAGSDFVAATNVPFSFEIGETSKQISVAIMGDEMPEEHESFIVGLALVGDPKASLATPEGTGTIINDDFIVPVITSPAAVDAKVAENVGSQVAALNTPTSFSLSGAPEGMTINEEGLISWVPEVAGVFQVGVTAENPAGSAQQMLTFTVAVNPLADVLEAPVGIVLRTGGDVTWVSETDASAIEGGTQAVSRNHGDNQSSWLEAEVTGPDYLGFWWRVSSEEDFDFLHLDVDGERRSSLTGLTEWQYLVLAIGPGTHLVRWTYSKDSSAAAGSDRGQLDHLQLASQSRPFLMEPTLVRVVAGVPVDYWFPASARGAAFTPTPIVTGGSPGEELSVTAEGDLVGTPTTEGAHGFTLSIQQDGTSLDLPATVEVVPASALGAAVNQPALVWVEEVEEDETGDWQAQAVVSRDGAAAEASGVEDDGIVQLSTYAFGPGTVSFWWKVSSELGFDGMDFEINGQFRASLSGQRDWRERTFELPYGWHRLTWSYNKDGDTSEGLDAGWVDGVSFGGYAGWVRAAGVGGRTNVAFDHDGDGRNLFFEYATGGSATAWDATPAAEVINGALEWAVGKRPGVLGAFFDAEVGDDLTHWHTSGRSILQDDEAGFRARDEVGVSTAGRRFIRGVVHPVK